MRRDMPTATKFRFDTPFDAEPPSRPETPAPEPVPEKVLTDADLAAAREQAFAAGREAGLADATAAAEQARADALSRLAQQLDDIVPRHADALSACRNDAVEIARAMVRKIISADHTSAVAGVEHMIASFMPRLLDEPRIVVRVNDALLDLLQDKMPSLADACGYRGAVILLSEPEMALADCRVEWADGGAERDTEALWCEIDASIEAFLAEAKDDRSPPLTEDQDLIAEEKPNG